MKQFHLFIVVLSFASVCSGQIASDKKLVRDDKPGNSKQKLTQQNPLKGIWRSDSDENPTFEIKDKVVLYFDSYENFKCKILKDSIRFYFKDGPITSKYYVKGDTLILSTEDGDEVYLRWKENK